MGGITAVTTGVITDITAGIIMVGTGTTGGMVEDGTAAAGMAAAGMAITAAVVPADGFRVPMAGIG